jgi:hypothetical protein
VTTLREMLGLVEPQTVREAAMLPLELDEVPSARDVLDNIKLVMKQLLFVRQ